MPEINTNGTSGTLSHQELDQNFAEDQIGLTSAGSPYTLSTSYNREHLVITSGATTIQLPDAGTLYSALETTDTGGESVDWYVKITNNSGSSGTISKVTGADTLNGDTSGTYTLVDNASVIVALDGTSGTKGYNIISEYMPDKVMAIFTGYDALTTGNLVVNYGKINGYNIGTSISNTAGTRTYMPTAGKVKNLRTYVGSGSNDGDVVLAVYKNGSATGKVSVTYGTGVTGELANTSTELSFVAGDYLQFIEDCTGCSVLSQLQDVSWAVEILVDV